MEKTGEGLQEPILAEALSIIIGLCLWHPLAPGKTILAQLPSVGM